VQGGSYSNSAPLHKVSGNRAFEQGAHGARIMLPDMIMKSSPSGRNLR